MTKNRSMRIAVLVLALALITCCFVGTTFAKYTSSATGSDSVTVAKWSIKVNNSEFAVADPAINFNLFETIKDTGDTTEEDVASERIAPGTEGSFVLKVKNESEVTANYSIDFTVENEKNVPIEFKVGNGEWGADLADIPATKLAMGSAEVDCTVYWRWVYEGDTLPADDVTDTGFGIAAQTTPASVAVTAKLTVTQAD